MKTMMLALTALLLTQQLKAQDQSLTTHEELAQTFDQQGGTGQRTSIPPVTVSPNLNETTEGSAIAPARANYQPVHYTQGDDPRPVSKGINIGAGAGLLAGAVAGAIIPLAIHGFTLTGGLWAAAGFFGGALTGGLAGLVIGLGVGLLCAGLAMKGRAKNTPSESTPASWA